MTYFIFPNIMSLMNKLFRVLLVLFIIFDIGLALVFFNPGGKVSKVLEILPKNCKVVDSEYCKGVVIFGNEKLNETVVAFFKLPKGTKVYAPVSGALNFRLMGGTSNLPYHTIKGDDGVMYYLVFEPETTPANRQVRAGEVVGVASGKIYEYMKNSTLGVSTVKNQRFDKASFDNLFR